MDLTPSKKLPYFSEYVAHELVESKKWKRSAWTWPIAGGAFLVAGLASMLLFRVTGFWTPPLLMIGWGVGIAMLDKWMKKPRSSDEQYLRELDSIVLRYAESMNFRRLHRDLDYTAAQLLEASAYYWSKVRIQMNSPAWNSASTPAHLRAVRVQTLQAIDEAMREQIALCARCLAVPGQKRSTDLRDVIEDALGIDVDKVLDSIRKGTVSKNGFQSERLPEIFDPARQLAERLKMLSGEIDKMSFETLQKYQGAGTGATSAIDAALRGMQEIRQAEGELSQDQHITDRL